MSRAYDCAGREASCPWADFEAVTSIIVDHVRPLSAETSTFVVCLSGVRKTNVVRNTRVFPLSDVLLSAIHVFPLCVMLEVVGGES